MMRLLLLATICTVAAAPAFAQKAPNWVKQTDHAAWQPRDSQGELVYNDKLWIFGGWFNSFEAPPRDVWSSRDGKAWTLVQQTAPWKHSDLSMSISFNDKMWFMGGWYNGRLEGHSASNQVWSSSDGIEWEQATASAGWSPRIAAAVVEFKGKIWLLGGTENYYFGDDKSLKNDVWSSADGKHWQQVTAHAEWSPRGYHQAAVLNDKIYLFGGGSYVPEYHALNDVWSSEDGVHWKKCGDAPWHPRLWFSSAVYRDRIWVLGGWSNNPSKNWGDVWHSSDGANWHQLKSDQTWKARHEHSAFVFADQLWIAGGHARPLSNEVWSLQLPKDWLPDDASELPVVAPKTPQASLKAIRLKKGFHAELAASEPLIRSPMAIDFDEFGRAFVVELPEYNQYASSKSHGKGAVKILEDLNQDGLFDNDLPPVLVPVV